LISPAPVQALIALQHLFLERWEFLAEVRELSRQVKGINATRIAQLALVDERQKCLAGFLGADLDGGLRPIMSGQESGIAARERLKDIWQSRPDRRPGRHLPHQGRLGIVPGHGSSPVHSLGQVDG
jgi:hypothetical protein